ncbi:MAG TPA: hypothetical protein DCM68_06165 [Verrucomicrobia bacterium]|nr:hypothetical protein [Verrucomicrobiota bacterium]
MSEPAAVPIPPVPDSAGKSVGLPPARLLRMSRGFSCLFWSLPLLSTAHAMAMASSLPARWMFGLLLLPFLPLVCGLWMLRASGDLTPRWGAAISRVSLLALVTVYLCPFLVWWTLAPMRLYFAANMAAHYFATIGLLAGMNRLAGECARGLDDMPLRREALAGLGMVLWLSACTLAALAWLFHRAGVLVDGLPGVLALVAELPREARTLFLLPYAMTAYVMWRVKETGFRRAAGPPP